MARLNPLQLAEKISNLIQGESEGAYRRVYDELRNLDIEFPNVTKNHSTYDPGNEPIEYAIANLLFSSHAAHTYPDPPMYTRKDTLATVKLLEQVPYGRTMLMDLMYELFPQAVFSMEHLFFLQRHIERLFSLPDEARPEELRGQRPCDWMYPMNKVQEIRNLAVDLWKEEEDRVNEARQQRK